MRYRVVVTPEAERDLGRVYSYIRDRGAPRAARTWLGAIRKRIKTLAVNPERAPLAPESSAFDESIRELFFGAGNRGTYRILFAIIGETVFVLHVRHGSIRPLI